MKHQVIALVLFSALILTIPNISPVQGAEILHFYDENTTCTQYSSANVTIVSISDSAEFDFISGRKYLLIATAQFGGGTSDNVGVKISIGSAGSTLAGSDHVIEPNEAVTSCANDNGMYPYFFIHVFTADGTDSIFLENSQGGVENYVDNASLFVMELSEDLTENTHWFSDTGGLDTTLGTAFDTDDDATITITGANADDKDWLVCGTASIDTGANNKLYSTRLNWDQGTDLPLMSQEGEDTSNDLFVQSFCRVINLSSSTSHILETESQRTSGGGGTHQRLSSEIFALNLSEFDVHAFDTDASTDVTTTEYDVTVQTVDVTPTATGDFLALHYNGRTESGAVAVEYRLQVEDNSSVLQDEPTGQSGHSYDFNKGWDPNDILPFAIFTVENINTNTHTINLDGSETGGTVVVVDASLLGLSMELASTPATEYVVDLLDLFESESTTLGSGISLCQNVDLEVISTCNSELEVGHTYRAEVTVINDGTSASSPTGFEMDSTVLNFGLLGTIPASQLLDSGCSTNTDWTESISSTDAVATSGTTCSISASGGTAVFWMVFRILSDAGGGADPTMTFTILGGGDTDTSTTTTFNVNNILQGGMY